MKVYTIFLLSFLWGACCYAQVGVGTTSPNSTAELHVSSATKGVLIPRLTDAQMNAIASPSNGLLVYNLTQKQFYYFNSTTGQWTPSHISSHGVVSDGDGDTKIDVDAAGNGSDNKIHFYAAADGNSTANGVADKVAILDSTSFVFTGAQAYKINGQHVLSGKTSNITVGNRTTNASVISGTQNTAIGVQAGNTIGTGVGNTLLGTNAGQNVTSGSNNTVVGANAATGIVATPLIGTSNVVVGSNTANLLQGNADGNTIIGYNSAPALTTGKGNIIIGNNSGTTLATGDSNIVIGNGISLASASKTRTLNIGGVITSDSVYHLKGNVTFLSAYTFPDVTGTVDQTLVVDDNGKNLIWADKTVAGQSAMTVTGAATDMKPYSRLAAANTYRQQPSEVYYIPVTAMSNGSISKISTYLLSTPASTTITAALFVTTATAGTYNIATNGAYKFRGSATTNSAGYVTIDFFNGDQDLSGSADLQSFNVTVGTKYVIALYSNKTGPTGTLFYENQDADNKGAKPSDGTIPDTKTGLTFGADLIWARAH